MTVTGVPVRYFGQLERSSDGLLWVVLFRDNAVIKREQVRSRRQGRRRRLIDLVLTGAEPFPAGPDPLTLSLDPGAAGSVVAVNRTVNGKVTADEIESTPRPRESRVRGATYPDSLRCGSPHGEASDVTRSFTNEPVWMAVRSILICDARPGICEDLARLAKNIPTAVDVAVVTDRFALSAAFTVKPADLVLIGLSPGSPDGAAATDRLLTQHPSANIIVYGSVHDTAVLAAAVARGAHGFLLWTPDERHQPSPHRFTATTWTRPHSTHRRRGVSHHGHMARPTDRTRASGPAGNQPGPDQPGNRS